MGVKRNLDEANDNVSSSSTSSGIITEAETELYDRQIRLWGMESQKRLRNSRILVIGLNGVGAEVVKNLALSGMKSITILDDTQVSESDSSAQFFCSAGELGKKRSEVSLPAIQELNPNVQILIETGDPSTKPDEFYADFEVVFATGLPMDLFCSINKICRDNNVQFYCADTWGFYGYCFLDLNHHKYKSCNTGNVNPPAKKIVHSDIGHKPESIIEQELHYFPLSRTLLAKVGDGLKKRINKVFVLIHIVNHFREMNLRYPQPANYEADIQELPKIRNDVCKALGVETTKITDEMLSSVFGELSPVCAAVGGILANEIIKGVTKTGLPVYNYFLFDGHECQGVNELVKKT